MISFTLPNRQVVPAFNAAMALQMWLRPGLLAYIVGSHAEALRTTAVRLVTERNALLEEVALKHPDVYAADDPAVIAGKANAGDAHPLAGQHVTMDVNGQTVTKFKSPAAGADFTARENELMNATTTVTVDERLTYAHMMKLDTERLAAPRPVPGVQAPGEAAVDFASLAFLIAAPNAHDTNGVAVPAVAKTPASVETPPASVPMLVP